MDQRSPRRDETGGRLPTDQEGPDAAYHREDPANNRRPIDEKENGHSASAGGHPQDDVFRQPAHDDQQNLATEEVKEERMRRGQRGDEENFRSRSGSYSQPPGEEGNRGQERRANHSPTQESSTVYVAGISRGVIQEDLREPFQRFGQIREIFMKGKYAFVEYENVVDAQNCIRDMNGATVRSHKITVEATKSRKGGGGKRTGPQESDECWKCGRQGHWANECREAGGDRGRKGGDRFTQRRRSRSNDRYHNRRSNSPGGFRGRFEGRGGRGAPERGRPENSRSRSPGRQAGGRDMEGRSVELREGRCFICKERGHIKRDCPELRNGGGDNSRRRNDEGGDRRPPYEGQGGNRRFHEQRGDRSYPPVRDDRRRIYSRSRSPQHRPVARRDYSPSRSPVRRHYDSPRSRSPHRRYAREVSRTPPYP